MFGRGGPRIYERRSQIHSTQSQISCRIRRAFVAAVGYADRYAAAYGCPRPIYYVKPASIDTDPPRIPRQAEQHRVGDRRCSKRRRCHQAVGLLARPGLGPARTAAKPRRRPIGLGRDEHACEGRHGTRAGRGAGAASVAHAPDGRRVHLLLMSVVGAIIGSFHEEILNGIYWCQRKKPWSAVLYAVFIIIGASIGLEGVE